MGVFPSTSTTYHQQRAIKKHKCTHLDFHHHQQHGYTAMKNTTLNHFHDGCASFILCFCFFLFSTVYFRAIERRIAPRAKTNTTTVQQYYKCGYQVSIFGGSTSPSSRNCKYPPAKQELYLKKKILGLDRVEYECFFFGRGRPGYFFFRVQMKATFGPQKTMIIGNTLTVVVIERVLCPPHMNVFINTAH